MRSIARFRKFTRSRSRSWKMSGSASPTMRRSMDKLEIKSTLTVDDVGTLTGTAWPFGSADNVGDIITKGAFHLAVDNLPMLFNHDPSDLVGSWDEANETPDGFVVKGRLHMDQPRARALHGL